MHFRCLTDSVNEPIPSVNSDSLGFRNRIHASLDVFYYRIDSLVPDCARTLLIILVLPGVRIPHNCQFLNLSQIEQLLVVKKNLISERVYLTVYHFEISAFYILPLLFQRLSGDLFALRVKCTNDRGIV